MELINFELDAISSTEPLDEIVQQRCLVSVYIPKILPIRNLSGYIITFIRFLF